MIITIENAEERLVKRLKVAVKEQKTHRCIQVKFLSPPDLNHFAKLVNDTLQSPDGDIFVCQDRETFIIAREISYKIFENLRKKLGGNVDTAKLLDIQKDWVGLIEYAEGKLKAVRSVQRQNEDQANARNAAQKKLNILNTPIDEKLIRTLPRRRGERETLEILVVEDDPFSRKLVGSALNADYATALVEDGRAGIMHYVTRAPDILFLDIELPDITGHDVLQKIFELDPNAFVVMLSGNGNKENIMQAVQNGAKGFVGKPFTKEKLLQYIHKCPKAQTLNTGV